MGIYYIETGVLERMLACVENLFERMDRWYP